MTEGMKAYQTFMAIKLHFTTNYDYFKYGGKTRPVDEHKVTNRRDFHFYRRLERRYKDNDLVNFFVSNFIDNDPAWIGDMMQPSAEATYKKWKQRQESFSYMLKEEIKSVLPNDVEGKDALDQLLAPNSNGHPKLLSAFLAKRVSLDTLLAIDSVLGYTTRWNKAMGDDFTWKNVGELIDKYRPFFTPENAKIKKVLREIFLD
jgi:hypothetical protein